MAQSLIKSLIKFGREWIHGYVWLSPLSRVGGGDSSEALGWAWTEQRVLQRSGLTPTLALSCLGSLPQLPSGLWKNHV